MPTKQLYRCAECHHAMWQGSKCPYCTRVPNPLEKNIQINPYADRIETVTMLVMDHFRYGDYSVEIAQSILEHANGKYSLRELCEKHGIYTGAAHKIALFINMYHDLLTKTK